MKLKVLLLTLFMLLPLTADASVLRFNGGTVMVKEGDPAYLLVKYLGEPLDKAEERLCVRSYHYHCTHWTVVETWFYEYRNLNWRMYIRGGKIWKMKWSRF